MITEDYVSFETAKLLKEKGFDAECDYLYADMELIRAGEAHVIGITGKRFLLIITRTNAPPRLFKWRRNG